MTLFVETEDVVVSLFLPRTNNILMARQLRVSCTGIGMHILVFIRIPQRQRKLSYRDILGMMSQVILFIECHDVH